jgi:hypothetical protein
LVSSDGSFIGPVPGRGEMNPLRNGPFVTADISGVRGVFS